MHCYIIDDKTQNNIYTTLIKMSSDLIIKKSKLNDFNSAISKI